MKLAWVRLCIRFYRWLREAALHRLVALRQAEDALVIAGWSRERHMG